MPCASYPCRLTVFLIALFVSFGCFLPSYAQSDAIRQVVADYHAKGQFDGVVLVAQNGRILCSTSAGLANRELSIPNTDTTPYRICSVTKQFTALLVMQEVAAGHLSLSGFVTDYLPDFRRDTGSKITLRNLLAHTSGLPALDDAFPTKNDVPGFYQQTDPKFAQPTYVVKTYLQGDLKTKPGEKFNYNNADYVVLAAILEKATGKSYAALLQERIFRPLGMTYSGLMSSDTFSPRQAIGYIQKNGALVPEPYQLHVADFGAAGAMYSTAADLLLWDNALDHDTLLAKPYREIMFTADKSLGYVALGSWVYPASFAGSPMKPVLVERDGGIGAFNLLNLRAPADGYSLIILSNVDTADLGAVYMKHGLAYDILKTLYSSKPQASASHP